MLKAKRIIMVTFVLILCILLLCAAIFIGIYFTRLKTLSTVAKISSYDDGYDLYRMDIKYNYSLDNIINYGLDSDQDLFDAILKEALPLLPVKIEAPKFGCTAFNLSCDDGEVLMGRNYDFKKNTSAMLVYCTPEDGYESVAFAALDNVSANHPEESLKQKAATLTVPFICLDGMNEKGVSIAVLVVDSEPVHQDTDKPNIYTTLAIRLVLDKAATTEEAIELLRGYDMLASSGKDYHFYINDASGDGRVVEWDCESETRELVALPAQAATNFYNLYEERVLPNQRNGIYGHGRERYDAVLEVFAQQEGDYSSLTAWDALKAAAQDPSSDAITSNTQWSIVYDNTDLTAQIVIRRNWGDVYEYKLIGNVLSRAEPGM